MPEYITRAALLEAASRRTKLQEEASIRTAAQRSPAGSTFLSHSTKDADRLPGVIAILERHGAEVYIDKKDEALPPTTSRKTAEILRGRIKECKKFVLLTSPGSKDSRWMPWELGLSDGYKKPANTAIFPSPEYSFERNWAEQEYLGIYDRIVYGTLTGFTGSVYMVWNQEANTATELSRWLNA